MGLIRGVRDFMPVRKSIHPSACGPRVYWFTNWCKILYTPDETHITNSIQQRLQTEVKRQVIKQSNELNAFWKCMSWNSKSWCYEISIHVFVSGLLYEANSDYWCHRRVPSDEGRNFWPRDVYCAIWYWTRGKHHLQYM
jgi:hypothetical protein